MLTPEQLAGWERDGFLVVEDFVSAARCDELKARAHELIAGFDPDEIQSIFSTHEQTRTSDAYFLTSGDKVRFFVEEEDTRTVNKIGHALHDLDPVFDAFSRNPDLAAIAKDIGMAEPLLLQSMYILKAPHVGGEVTSHTDHTFLWTEPASAVGMWFAIEDATLENGCMWALPGGHRLPVHKRFRREGDGTVFDTFVDEAYPSDGEVPLPARKGTLILLHGLLPHRSDANRSDHPRDAYTVHVIDGAARYLPDNWLQRDKDAVMTAGNRDDVRRSFAGQAGAFEDPGRHFGRADVMAWLSDNTPGEPADVVLEVAAGTALFGRAIAARVAAVLAVDLTPEMLAEGKRACDEAGTRNLVFQVGDATALPFLDDSFDRVISRLAIHHFEDSSVPLREMARVCRPGGTVTIVDMVATEPDVVDRFNELEHLRDPAHTRALTRHGLRVAMEDAGLRITHTASRDNVLHGESWLAQTSTPPDAADMIRAAWRAELDGGARTGMSVQEGADGVELVHHWDLLVGVA